MLNNQSIENRQRKWMLIISVLIVTAFIGLVWMTGISAKDLFEVGEEASNTFLTKIQDLYCDSLFPLIVVVDLVWLALTHNEKTTGKLITALKWAVGAFVLVKGIDWIANTITNNITF